MAEVTPLPLTWIQLKAHVCSLVPPGAGTVEHQGSSGRGKLGSPSLETARLPHAQTP